MATAVDRRRDQDKARLGHAFHFALGNAEFGRVDEIVGGINPQHRHGDFFQQRRGVVVARTVVPIQRIVGVVVARHETGIALVERFFRLESRGKLVLQQDGVGAGDDRKVGGGAQSLGRRRGVVAAVPQRIGLDRVDRHLAPHPVAPGDLDRLARKRREAPGKPRMLRAPDEGVHAPHRRAEDDLQVPDLEAVHEQPPLRLDHVVIIIFRKRHPHPVRRFG